MQLYNATVRLGGSMLNEVPMFDVSAAEVKVLKAIHSGPDTGVDVVYKITAAKRVDRADDEERDRLREKYEPALRKIDNIGSLEKLLGFEGTPLPQTISGVDSLPPPKTGRRARVEAPEPAEDPVEPIKESEFA